MKYRFFAISALAPESEQAALNTFCAGRRVVTVEKHFVPQGAESYWSICVTYDDGPDSRPLAAENRRERVDYKAILSEADFAVYAELRILRKTLSKQEGVPAYTLFTNEQLAEMVTRRARTLADLGAIDGIGKARLERYGQAFLERLAAWLNGDHATSHDASPEHRTE